MHNYSLSCKVNLKTASISATGSPSKISRQKKSVFELPKILPIHNMLRHKRYIESCAIYQPSSINLLGIKCKKKSERYLPNYERSTIDLTDKEDNYQEKYSTERVQTPKETFICQTLRINGIEKIHFQKRQKLKVFVDEGNNSRVINEILRKRNSLRLVSNKSQANIVWTPFCDWQVANSGSKYLENNNSFEKNKGIHKISISLDRKQFPVIENGSLKEITMVDLKVHNHLKNHHEISDKKYMFKNIRKYCRQEKISENEIIPITYHIQNNIGELPADICDTYDTWIVKPGEDTNRGIGISVQRGRENIISAIKGLSKIGKSSLVQLYIEPLLFKNRKFDIRCYTLVTSYRGVLKAYWYKEGYLRTCSKQFTQDPNNLYGHLTNDAVQKKCKDYGKFQQCNKLSFTDLENILKAKDISFSDTLEKMKKLAYHSIKSAQEKLKCEKNMFAFEIFGYDFLLDSKGKVWLIEINTNPCLQFAGSLLSRIIYHMIQNSFAIAIDPLIQQQPEVYSSMKDKFEKIYEQSKYECII